MESIEANGKSVDEAVQQALTRLGKRRDQVEITVLQEPVRGAFGLGSKDALVRVSLRPSNVGALITPELADAILGSEPPSKPSALITPELADAILGSEVPLSEEELYAEDEQEFAEDEFDEDELDDDEELEDEESAAFLAPAGFGAEPTPFLAPAGLTPTQLAGQADISVVDGELQEVETPTREDIEITVDILQHILHYMNIRATVQVRTTEPLTLNIHGINENLGLLIGRRGETLSALQLLVSLIVGHRTKHRMRIIVDAENYRERREANLRSLALRVAQQVRNYRRSIALEAMPPNERRIVHIALSDSKDISTESIGEGEARRVVISLKRPAR